MIILDLGGSDWTVQQAGTRSRIKATVPGAVHTDLLAAGKIPDPFYRDNETDLLWIGDVEWTYSRIFDVPKTVLRRDQVLLHFAGLDTLATVTLNGKRLGKTDNMFREWCFDIKKLLKPGRNVLEIRFASATQYGKRQQKRLPFRPLHEGDRIPGLNHVRKEQCNAGWDWGPKCPTCGIYRPVRIIAFDTARLADIHIEQSHQKKTADLSIKVTAETARRTPLRAAVTVSLAGKTVAEAEVALRSGKGRSSLRVTNPKLWWPNGMGEQPLYEVTVDLLTREGDPLDTRTKRIGLRTLRLVRKKDRWGESFRFEANGIPFFAKGANWIPAEVFQASVTPALFEYLLKSARQANMNMIRVWGGGVYEEDAFYDLCDELGLCVWQDFMFACASYPACNKTFMANVKVEAEENIKRLRHHACLALWCGNNELEQCGHVQDKGRDNTMTWPDYRALFDKLLPSVVKKHDPGRDYWPSSQHTPGKNRRDSGNPDAGDGHLWSVWHGRQPFEWYRTAFHRFCSEFGFQSFPEPATVKDYTLPEDRNVTSFIMEHHQRSGIGNSTIMHYMLSWYRMPKGFENCLWLSQIQQGMAIKYAVEHWRRNMPRCMGALYWQLNDCWPVASWASIDYPGRWKALHYMARRFYSSLLVSGVEDTDKGTVELHVTSDVLKALPCRIEWSLTTAQGRKVASGKVITKTPRNGTRKTKTLDLSSYVEKHTSRDLMLWLSLVHKGRVVSRNFVTFARPKHLPLVDPAITTKVKDLKDGGFAVTLKAKKPALWAWLELKNMDTTYSDNFLCLEPGRTETILLYPEKSLTAAQLKKRLKVKSIWDTYQ